MLGVAHPKEFSFPVLIGVLEEGEDDPARDAGEAHPKAFPLFLHFEEMQENIHGRKDAQVPAENLEAPYECPAVGMELGGGCVNFRKESPLKGCEGEAHPNAFKHRLVHKEEGTPLSRSVIHTHRFPRSARTNGDVRVVSAAEGIKVIQVGVPTVILQVLKGCQAGALVQKLVGGQV